MSAPGAAVLGWIKGSAPVSDKHGISAVISPLLASAFKLGNGTSHLALKHLPD